MDVAMIMGAGALGGVAAALLESWRQRRGHKQLLQRVAQFSGSMRSQAAQGAELERQLQLAEAQRCELRMALRKLERRMNVPDSEQPTRRAPLPSAVPSSAVPSSAVPSSAAAQRLEVETGAMTAVNRLLDATALEQARTVQYRPPAARSEPKKGGAR